MNSVRTRNNVNVSGNKAGKTLILAHGFGCDQNMWRFMAPLLEEHFQIILFDYVGSGKSLLEDYSVEKYSKLEGYAEDIIDIVDELQLTDVSIIGHSVSATIASIAASKIPNIIKSITMICPSPCFLNFPPEYQGGFEREDLEELIELMDKNYIGWANYLAPLVMGASHSQDLIGELSGSFCSTDPLIAQTFAKATFFSDYRHLLPVVTCPSLIIQSSTDNLAAVGVGRYMADKIPNSRLEIVNAEGHCLHMTNYQDILPTILKFLE